MNVTKRVIGYGTLVALIAIAGAVRYRQSQTMSEDEQIAAQWSAKIDPALFTLADTEPLFTKDQMLVSQLCTQSQFETDLYKHWVDELGEQRTYRRKQWEHVYILQALSERGLLRPGKRGLGFGVGQEALPAVFAKHGVEVLATDLEMEAAARSGWVATDQHLSSIDLLNKQGIAPPDEFRRLVTIKNVDMTQIPADLQGFDFTWSACSLEHLGSLENGLVFIENSLKTLVPGGIAVHTTEYNVSSDTRTVLAGGTVIYRKRDIKELVRRLTAAGHEVHVNYNYGHGELDRYIDTPPYSHDKHLKLHLSTFVTTSIGLIIRKNPTP